jgi:hypothetical protein
MRLDKFVPLMRRFPGLINRCVAHEHHLRVLVFLSTSILLCSCASSQQFSAIGASNIKHGRQLLNDAVATRRIADFVSLLAEDVVDIIPSGARKGKDEVVRDFESLLKRRPDLTLILTPDRIETYPLWSLAAESGHWYESWTERGDFTELRGAYFAMWKLSDAKWLVSSQIITPLSCKGTIYCNAE